MAHHQFEPQTYHHTIGTHEPVLHIAPGDTVSTTTVDARGRDASNEQVIERGNPMTGPFYIEGAEPGDTLIVNLDRLYPNRSIGWTGTSIAANVLDPGFVPQFDQEVEQAEWTVDLEAGTVRLAKPETRLTGLELPLKPMVGCFGVAPPRGLD